MAFVELSGLVQLALLLHLLAGISDHVRFMAPLSFDANSYLARMGFYVHVPQEVELVGAIPTSSSNHLERSDVLIPLKHFHTSTDVEDLGDEVRRFLQGQDLPSPLHHVLWLAVAELCGNAASHSRSPCGGFLAAQTYQGQKRYLSVGDVGIGIRQHLARNPHYVALTDDAAAIREAIKPGVSGTPEARGYGFEEVQGQAERAKRASLFIRSGTGWGRIAVTRERRARTFGSAQPAFPGTLVQLVLDPG